MVAIILIILSLFGPALPQEIEGIDRQVNAVRIEKGLSPLTLHEPLNESATLKAHDLVARGYWAHDTPDGKKPWTFFTLKYEKAGENLARCYTSTQEAVNAWIDSPSHYAVMTGDYTHFGFGFARDKECVVITSHYIK